MQATGPAEASGDLPLRVLQPNKTVPTQTPPSLPSTGTVPVLLEGGLIFSFLSQEHCPATLNHKFKLLKNLKGQSHEIRMAWK